MAEQRTLQQVDRLPGEIAGESDEEARAGRLQREYVQLSKQPGDELHDAMCRMVRAEFALDDDALHRFVRARLLAWSRLEDDRAMIVTEAYRHAIESVEAKIALRNAEFVQATVGDLPPKTQERLRAVAPVMFDDQATPQLSEGASATYGTARHATIGTPVVAADGKRLGRVGGVESKYFEVEPDHGDAYWLTVDDIDEATPDRLTVTFAADQRDRFALEQLEPGEEGSTTGRDAEALTASREDEARRQYLVRGRDEREPEEHEEGPFDSPEADLDNPRPWGWHRPA